MDPRAVGGETPDGQRLGFARFAVAWEQGEDLILRDAPHVVMAHTPAPDPMGPGAATIAMTYFQLAAAALGLGTCWAGYLQIALGMARLWSSWPAFPRDARSTPPPCSGMQSTSTQPSRRANPRRHLDVDKNYADASLLLASAAPTIAGRNL